MFWNSSYEQLFLQTRSAPIFLSVSSVFEVTSCIHTCTRRVITQKVIHLKSQLWPTLMKFETRITLEENRVWNVSQINHQHHHPAIAVSTVGPISSLSGACIEFVSTRFESSVHLPASYFHPVYFMWISFVQDFPEQLIKSVK